MRARVPQLRQLPAAAAARRRGRVADFSGHEAARPSQVHRVGPLNGRGGHAATAPGSLPAPTAGSTSIPGEPAHRAPGALCRHPVAPVPGTASGVRSGRQQEAGVSRVSSRHQVGAAVGVRGRPAGDGGPVLPAVLPRSRVPAGAAGGSWPTGDGAAGPGQREPVRPTRRPARWHRRSGRARPPPYCRHREVEVPGHLADRPVTGPIPVHDLPLELRGVRPTVAAIAPLHGLHDGHPFRRYAPSGGCPSTRANSKRS